MNRCHWFLLAIFSACSPTHAVVHLPPVISDHMVLQKSARTAVWGNAEPGEEVTVSVAEVTAVARADANGQWKVFLNLEGSGPGPYEMTVRGSNTLKISDVLIGEVWLASGQSNMDMGLGTTLEAGPEIARSKNSLLRQFRVRHVAVRSPQEDVPGNWEVAGPKTAAGFSGVGYYFGKTLQAELRAPVGLVFAAWGATPIEAWTSAGALGTVPELKAARERREREFDDYPARRQKFVSDADRWLTTNGRSDRAGGDASKYAAPELSLAGWTPVSKPGPLSAAGLPAHGAIWLRKDIELPAEVAGKPLFLRVAWNENHLSIYWNGQCLREGKLENVPPPGQGIGLTVSGSLVNAGRNVLALRVYAPVSGATTPAPTLEAEKLGRLPLPENWLAKEEFSLPAPTTAAKSSLPVVPVAPLEPSNQGAYLFNGMIHPLLSCTIRGVIWYQGEANTGRAWQYRIAFPLLIKDWRSQFGSEGMPFYFCQLAGFKRKNSQPGESEWAELRDAQSAALDLPGTGMAVLLDIGEQDDIHPSNKRVAGERLAWLALGSEYGRDFSSSGPRFRSMKQEGNKIRLFFGGSGGLVAAPVPANYVVRSSAGSTAPLTRNSPESELEGFAICGRDGKWLWADAKIEGDSVVVWSDRLAEPTAVRYGWSDFPTANLFGKNGLPAGPFRTDDFPLSTHGRSY